MASTDRRQTFNIKDVLTRGNHFSFAQAVRLHRYFMYHEHGTDLAEEDMYRSIRIRPMLSLGFPETDIESIEEIDGDGPRYLLTTTFMGLYGVSSPLPTFYTEDLMDEELRDSSVTRDFLDIINAPFYRLFYQCWSKYRQYVKIVDEHDHEYLERLFCFLGFGIEAHRSQGPDVRSLIPYIGLFTQFPRSALGLKTLLADILNEPRIDIEQCVPREAAIPEDQRLYLGISNTELGVNAYLGRMINDRMGAFRITIGPVDADTFHDYLPECPQFEAMAQYIEIYLDNPLAWDAKVLLEAGETVTVSLGEPRWSHLGWDTWIFAGERYGESVAAMFQEPMACSGRI